MDSEAYAKHNKPEDGAKPGVYKHSGTTDELHAATFPAADAFVRQGWVYDRPLPKAEETRGVVATPEAVKVNTSVEVEKKGK